MKRVRTLLLLALTLLVVATAAYAIYWYRLAAGIEAGVDRWAEARRAEGWAVAWESLHTSGFPGPIQVTIEQPLLARPDGLRWQTGRATAHVPPHDPGRIALAFQGAHRVVSPRMPGPVSLVPDQAVGALRVGADGRLRSAEARLRGVEAAAPGLAARAQSLALDFDNAADIDAASLALRLRNLEWQVAGYDAAALPPRVEVLRLRLRVTPLPALTAPPVHAAAEWQARGGRIEVHELALDWQPLTVAAEGEASLDDALQPAVSLDAAIGGLDDVVARLSRAGRVDADQARSVQTVLGLMARREDDGSAVLRAPLSVRDGRLFLGPVPVAPVPPIDWSAIASGERPVATVVQ